ncbi:MAG: DNA polymerase III subunit alpha [bacterium]|nr:DNA polymerase III subunit alpha [bacterium]
MGIPQFTHLHTHTEFSLLDGLAKIPALVRRIKELGMTSLAITDHGNMFGAIQFYKECIALDIKPIIGCEMYMATRSHRDKEPEKDQERNHLVLLAINEQGYKNLMRLVSEAYLHGFYYRPRIDTELLATYHEGLIGLSGCLGGEIPAAILAGNFDKARTTAKKYKDMFGEDHFYLELQHHNIDELPLVNKGLLELSKELSIPVVATNDIHYVNKEDAEAHDVLLCIQTGKTVGDTNRLRMLDSPDYYVRSQAEMAELFHATPEALENTQKITEMVSFSLELGKFTYPDFPVPEDETPASYLRGLVESKTKDYYPRLTDEIRSRIDMELTVITSKNYAPYFLIVQDFVNWAKECGIAVGPGRGSAAGSIVSYILGITSIDPLVFGLPFERFINPMRPSAPDIDLDFADNRRDEVVAYVMKKYGEDHVAHISTFGTMMSRGSIRDVGRALGHPYAFPDKIAKLIPFSTQANYIPIKKAIDMVPELTHMMREDPDANRLLTLAQKIEGNIRHASVHAAGVVIAPKPLWEYTPIMREAKAGKIVTQYEMHSVGEDGVGLLKIDILGLSNLSIIQSAAAYIKQYLGEEVDMATIPMDDKKTFAMLSEGETTGVFQLESSGMRRYIKELKPSNVYDLMAMVALFRPGPMNAIPEYIRRKHNPRFTRLLDPRMEKILERSLGLLVYQDDVLFIAIELAGYNWQEVDKLRKAMGKKIAKEMAAEKEKFIKRIVERGMPQDKAEKLWSEIEIFAGYGFNKAHAACYGLLACQTAYLKANYPAPYMAAVMTVEAQNAEKIASAMMECRRMDISVLPPSINDSDIGFILEEVEGKWAIRFGLSAIKNVGSAAISSIVTARGKNGSFRSLVDVCNRVDLRTVNRKTFESLIKAGATSSFGKRSAQIAMLDSVLQDAHREERERSKGQVSLFEITDGVSLTVSNEKLPDIDEVPKKDLLRWEKELLGLYLTEHPLTEVLDTLATKRTHRIIELRDDEGISGKIVLAGLIISVRKIFTRKTAEEMAFFRLEDETGEIEMVVFPRVFADAKALIRPEQIVVVHGKIAMRDDERNFIVDAVFTVDESPSVDGNQKRGRVSSSSGSPTDVTIRVPSDVDRQLLVDVYNVLKLFPGEVRVGLNVVQGEAERVLSIPYTVSLNPQLTTEVEAMFGLGSFNVPSDVVESSHDRD